MDINILEILKDYLVPVIVGICFLVGYMIKNAFDQIPNKYIPLIMGVLGLILSIASNIPNITLVVILQGLASGFAATGAYEAYKQLKKDKE